MEASAKGYGLGRSQEIDVQLDSIDNVDITMDRGGTLAGKVVDSNNAPVEKASVMAQGSVPVDVNSYNSTVTGVDGKFILNNVQTNPNVGVYKEGYNTSGSKTVALGPGEIRSDLVFKLEKNDTISGNVLSKSGAGITSGLIRLKGAKDISKPLEPDGQRMCDFKFSGVPDGKYTVIATVHGKDFSKSDIKPGDSTVNIVVDDTEWARTTTLIGTVIDAETSVPVEHIRFKWGEGNVDASRPGGFHIISGDPHFTFTILAPGYVDLRDQLTLPREKEIKQSFAIKRKPREIEGGVSGRVVDGKTNRGIAGVNIAAFEEVPLDFANRWNVSSNPESYTVTDQQGRFILPHVTEGRCEIQVYAEPPLSSTSRDFDLTHNAKSDVGDIPVFPQAIVHGHIYDHKGALPNMYVGLSNEIGPKLPVNYFPGMETMTNESGEFQFTGLPQGDYVIFTSDGRSKTVHLESGDDKSMDFQLESGPLPGQ